MNTIAACSEWRENLQGNDGESNPGNKRGKFCSFGYFEGVPQRIDTELFHEDTGIYEGNPHDALVWPDTDPDEKWLEKIAKLSSGLVLFSGPTGSGKSTTMARVLEQIGKEKARHIVTFEDPVEYVLSVGKSLVRQREIGRDAVSFAEGVRESLREDPDVIAVGEMRDRETIAAALTAAETGHLVLGTLHNGRALEAVGRMVHVFPAEEQNEVRLIISSVLRCVSAQRLWRMGTKTVLLREILTNTPAVANLIREGKEAQVLSYMETGVNDMRTLRQAVYKVKGVTEKEREELLHLAGE